MRSIIKCLLALFLIGFIYHLTFYFVNAGYAAANLMYDTVYYVLRICVSLILLGICFKFCKANYKTCDENHHRINKIR